MYSSCANAAIWKVWAGEALISRHIKLSPVAEVPVTSIVAFAKPAGITLESLMSTPILTAPAATGHVNPAQTTEPKPSGKLMVFPEHKSSLKFSLMGPALTLMAPEPADTALSKFPEPVICVFCPKVNWLGERFVILAW